MLTATYKLGAKGATHSPRAGNLLNNLSWQGLQTALKQGGGKATGNAIVKAIQAANPNNVGNAIGYTKYAIRNQWLTATKAKAA